MKKIFITITAIVSIALAVFFGWYLFLRNSDIPTGVAIRDILPFGSQDNTQLITDDERRTTEADSQISDEFGNPTANLFRLSNTPVAGAVIIDKEDQTVVRYVDRATGHIYDANLATLEKTRVTNNTLPKIYEAYFRSDGNAVLLRSLKDDSDVVENLSLTLTPPKATSTLYAVSSTSLRGNMSAVASGSGNVLFYVLKDTASIVTSAFNGAPARTLFSSPFTNWQLAAAGNSLIVYTKASANASGFAYTLNTSNGAFVKILGPLNGLIAIPNTLGNRALYSYVENNETKLFAKNLANGSLSEILPATLAEKCVWSARNAGVLFCGVPTDGPASGEPDNWYRGATRFSDRIWFFNTNSDVAKVLAEPRQSLRIDIDVVEPKLSPNEDYLVFINKTDLSLWALRLEAF